MKDVQMIMGMPVTIEVTDKSVRDGDLKEIFSFFRMIDAKFSPFKEDSEVSLINKGEIKESGYSHDMRLVLELAQQTKEDTGGYFDVYYSGDLDPSGIVKGWAILEASKILGRKGFSNYYVNAGGDIQTAGLNSDGQAWRVGITNPFNVTEIIKAVELQGQGIATSGTYRRGEHIYNPMDPENHPAGVSSLTVIAPDVYEADRLATAAFVMGRAGMDFLAGRYGVEAYMVDNRGQAIFTPGLNKYLI